MKLTLLLERKPQGSHLYLHVPLASSRLGLATAQAAPVSR